MSHEVLISYSSHDKLQADAICNRLESQGIRCWIAPRDVPGGTEYADSIVKAIELCQVLLLVYSSAAKESEQVKREVERAVSEGKKIMPVRIEEASMSKTFEYYVGSIHWLDAITPPLEKHIDKLASDLKSLLERDEEEDGQVVAPADQSTAAAEEIVEKVAPQASPAEPGQKEGAGGGKAPAGAKRGPLIAGGAVVLAVIGALAFYFVSDTKRVPNLVDMPYSQAVAELKDEKLDADVRLVASDSAASGMVVGSSPAAGDEVKPRERVTLEVSGMVLVPNLASKQEDAARAEIQNLGSNLRSLDPDPITVEVSYEPAEAASGTVLRSEPAAGSRIMMGETVKLVVAAERVAVPDLVGMSRQEAVDAIEAAGLTASVVTDWSPEAEVGTVFRTDPPLPGDVIPESVVTLTVAAKGGWAYLSDNLDLSGIEGSVVPMPTTMNIRSEPQGDRLGSIARDTPVRVLDTTASGWAKIVVAENE